MLNKGALNNTVYRCMTCMTQFQQQYSIPIYLKITHFIIIQKSLCTGVRICLKTMFTILGRCFIWSNPGVALLLHKSRVSGSNPTSGYCLCLCLAWVSSRFSSFLPHHKNMRVGELVTLKCFQLCMLPCDGLVFQPAGIPASLFLGYSLD